MTNFLNHKFIFLLIFFLMGLGNRTLASDIDIYREFFSSNRISLDYLSIPENSSPKEINLQFARFNKEILLVESSQIDNDFISNFLINKNYKLVIFLCNSDYVEKELFSCNTDSINFFINKKDFSYEKLDIHRFYQDKIKNDNYFNIIKNQNLNIIIFNESLFNNQFKKEELIIFLSSFKKSLEVTFEDPYVEKKSLKDTINLILKSYLVSLLYSIISILFIFLFIGKFFIYLNSINFSLKKLNFKSLLDFIEEFTFGVFKKNIFSKIFFLFIFTLILVIFTQYYLADKENLLQIPNYNFLEFLEEKKYERLILYLLYISGLFIIVISRIEILFDFLKKVPSLFKNKKIKKSFLRDTFVLLIIFLSFILLIFNKNYFLELKYLYITLCVFIGFLLYKFNLDLKNIGSNKYKAFISLLSILIPIIGYFIFTTNSSYRKEELIKSSDQVVLLPFKKELADKVLISEFNIDSKLNFPILIDNYLVFYPEKNSIVNQNISKFDEKQPFTIVSNNLTKIFENLLKNPVITQKLRTDPSSLIFYFDHPSLEIKSENTLLEVKIDCTNLSTKEFKYTIYYLDNSNIFKSKKYSSDNFLNCFKDERTYYFDIFYDLKAGKNYIISIDNSLQGKIKDLNIVSTNNNFNYLKIASVYKIAVIQSIYYFLNSSDTDNSSTIYNYFVENINEYRFSNNIISESINKLIQDGVIKGSFIIWSNESLRFIKNKND